MKSNWLWILLAALLFAALWTGTRFWSLLRPMVAGFVQNPEDPATLHLRGEFVESNLGVAQEKDGAITLRLVGQQYLFVPQCVTVPVGKPVKVRITSADVNHKFIVRGTNYQVGVEAGALGEATVQLPHEGKFDVQCDEFCGPGHYAMRAEMVAVAPEKFAALNAGQRESCAVGVNGVGESTNTVTENSEVVRVPSNVAWTPETLKLASNGEALRGLLIARRCDHCHGAEGFSAAGIIPNLAGMDKLALWKELDDYASGKRVNGLMQQVAVGLTPEESADLAAYYAMLPRAADAQDNRAFPAAAPTFADAEAAAKLVALGDGTRGIPPCQACHGPVGYRQAALSLATQNGDYILMQLEGFARRTRTNDINMPMRSIAASLSEDERHALAKYYGAGMGNLPAGAVLPNGAGQGAGQGAEAAPKK